MAFRLALLRPFLQAPILHRSELFINKVRSPVPIALNILQKSGNNLLVRSFSTNVDRSEIERRVLNVCKSYDRINADKLNVDSHFTNDLGLDSLDHIEVIMEIENEFGLEIPDIEAEKLMTPSAIIEMLYQKKLRRVKLDS